MCIQCLWSGGLREFNSTKMASARRPRTSSKPATKLAGGLDRDEDGGEKSKQRVRKQNFHIQLLKWAMWRFLFVKYECHLLNSYRGINSFIITNIGAAGFWLWQKLDHADYFHLAIFFQISLQIHVGVLWDLRTMDVEVMSVIAGDAEAKIDRYAWTSLEWRWSGDVLSSLSQIWQGLEEGNQSIFYAVLCCERIGLEFGVSHAFLCTGQRHLIELKGRGAQLRSGLYEFSALFNLIRNLPGCMC